MSLFKEIVKDADTKELIESAAAGSTSAGAVAGVRGRIGDATSEETKMFARNIPKTFKSTGYEEDEENTKKRKRKKTRMSMGGPVGGAFSFRFESNINEGPEDEKFDPADVISKLRAAQEKSNKEDDTTGFALEDGDGRIVKVYVAQDEAEDFEKALGAALSGEDGDDDEENTSLEIAEVLFNLKDRYSIVDVVWPPVDGDPEEQETTGEGDLDDDTDIDVEGEGGEGAEGEGGEGAEGAEGDEGDLGDAEGDMEADLQADGEGEDLEGDEDEGVKSALDSVIDLLRAQADATKAEANSKEAEANAEEAKWNAQTAELKMKQEEEVLDMEAHQDKVKKAEGEAKKLKDLAKWRHKTAQTADDALNADTLDADVDVNKEVDVDVEPPGEEEEERIQGEIPGEEIPGNKFEPGFDENRNRRMSPGEFIKYIFQHQRAQ